MGLVHVSITYIFSNKINYLVEDFMSLEVLVIPSLSCGQNLEKKGIYYPLTLGVGLASNTVHIRISSGREANEIDG